MIYFAQAGDGPIKIGYSGDPEARLIALQTAHYEKLHMVATVEGDPGLERALHAKFSDKRIAGEWFDISHQAIGEIIKTILDEKFEYKPEPKPELLEELHENQQTRAKRLIIDLLTEHDDWFPAKELEETIEEMGICSRNIKQARSILRRNGVIERRNGGVGSSWQWRLANSSTTDAKLEVEA